MEYIDTVKSKPNDELLKMVYEFETWSPEMLQAVEKELATRSILPDDVNDRRQVLIDQEKIELENGKEASLFGLAIGWLTVFGLLGIGIGYNYAFSKTRSKYTETVYFEYSENSRKNGTYLFYTSLILSSIAVIYKLFSRTVI